MILIFEGRFPNVSLSSISTFLSATTQFNKNKWQLEAIICNQPQQFSHPLIVWLEKLKRDFFFSVDFPGAVNVERSQRPVPALEGALLVQPQGGAGGGAGDGRVRSRPPAARHDEVERGHDEAQAGRHAPGCWGRAALPGRPHLRRRRRRPVAGRGRPLCGDVDSRAARADPEATGRRRVQLQRHARREPLQSRFQSTVRPALSHFYSSFLSLQSYILSRRKLLQPPFPIFFRFAVFTFLIFLVFILMKRFVWFKVLTKPTSWMNKLTAIPGN